MTVTATLGIDPGSIRAGYAVAHRKAGTMEAPDLIAAGLVTAPAARPITERVHSIADDLLKIAYDLDRLDEIVIELPSKHAPHRGQSRSGQALYGYGVGYLHAALAREGSWPITTTNPAEWTAGVVKRIRQASIAALYDENGYNTSDDRGADAADALGLILWHHHNQLAASL